MSEICPNHIYTKKDTNTLLWEFSKCCKKNSKIRYLNIDGRCIDDYITFPGDNDDSRPEMTDSSWVSMGFDLGGVASKRIGWFEFKIEDILFLFVNFNPKKDLIGFDIYTKQFCIVFKNQEFSLKQFFIDDDDDYDLVIDDFAKRMLAEID